MSALLRADASRPGYDACTGCNLCVLPCPVFRDTRDLALTLRGRAKALQAGASIDEIRPSLAACVTCGACEPVCPEDIDTVGWTLEYRARLSSPLAAPLAMTPAEAPVEARVALLPGGLDEHAAQRVAEALGATIAADTGADLAHALEAGLPLDERRIARFTASLAAVRTLVVADGRLHVPLRRWLRHTRVLGLAEALVALPGVRAALGAGDLLVLEPRGYHADFARLVGVWDGVRKETGVQMSLDLHRLAIATGTSSLRSTAGTFPLAEQASWLLEGRTVSRILVESPHDLPVLRDATTTSVVSLSELA